jgi:hypothetical protein
MTEGTVVELNLPATAESYTFQAPREWGSRAAPGRLQAIISDMVQTEADLAFAIGNYDALINQIENTAAIISAKNGMATDVLQLKTDERDTIRDYNAAIQFLRVVQGTMTYLAESAVVLAESSAEGLPKGVDDFTAPARGIAKLVGATAQLALRGTALATGTAADIIDADKERLSLDTEVSILGKEFPVEIQEQLKELNEYLINEGTTRIAIFRLQEQLRAQADQYRAALQKGLRLVEEREVSNQRIAAAAQRNR